MPDVNWLAILLCAVSSLVIGGLWYSPVMFARRWQAEADVSDERMASATMPAIFGGAFVLSFIAAWMFATFLGRNFGFGPAVGAGLSAGLCWVAASFGINYLFERRSFGLWLINGGYHVLQFTAFGAILGGMR